MRQFRLLVILVGLLAASCSKASASDVTEGDLDGHTFVSTEVVGRPVRHGTHVEIRFQDGGMVFGSGCHEFTGAYSVDGGRLNFDRDENDYVDAGACLGPGQPNQVEAWVQSFVADRPVAELVGQRLILTRGDDVIRFRFHV